MYVHDETMYVSVCGHSRRLIGCNGAQGYNLRFSFCCCLLTLCFKRKVVIPWLCYEGSSRIITPCRENFFFYVLYSLCDILSFDKKGSTLFLLFIVKGYPSFLEAYCVWVNEYISIKRLSSWINKTVRLSTWFSRFPPHFRTRKCILKINYYKKERFLLKFFLSYPDIVWHCP